MNLSKLFLFFCLSFSSSCFATEKLTIDQKSLIKEQKANNQKLSTKNYINKIYKNISGFGISINERKKVDEKGGSATYGEITYESLKTILDDLKLGKSDVFYDLGSGVGKTVIQVYLDSPVKKSVGIELAPSRHKNAVKVKKQLVKDKKINNKRKLNFYEQNIADAQLSDATVVYMCSTCYPQKLMETITEKLSKLKKGLKVLSLKVLPKNGKFKLIKTYNLKMTWSPGSNVYLYELKK